MKIFLLFAVLMCGAQVVQAMPSYGDFAKFKVKSTRWDGSISWELTGYDKHNDAFLQTTVTVKDHNKPQYKDEWIRRKDFYTTQQIRNYIAECRYGVKEKVKVPAGIFKSCRVIMDESNDGYTEIWFADVPFGIAQGYTTKNHGNDELMYSLSNYNYGWSAYPLD